MSMAICGIDRRISYDPSLVSFFVESVSMAFMAIEEAIAQIKESRIEREKDGLLKNGRELVRVMNAIAENNIPLDQETISMARELALWMEAYLDGEDRPFTLSEGQMEDLGEIYTGIVSALSTIMINEEMR